MFDLVAIGNPVYDIIITPYVRTNERVLSGCSTNAALTFGKLGGKVALVGKIGRDFLSDFIDVLKQYNISAFPLMSNQTGGFYLRYLDERMSDRELRILGIADKINWREFPQELVNSKSFLIGPILQEINLEFVRNLTKEVDDSLILIDPQGLIRELQGDKIIRIPNKDAYEIIRITHITKPNEHEARTLFPDLSFEKIARKIYKLNNFVGIVTLAEKGSIIAYDKGIYHIPAYKTTERDPTGCGDVYGGAFLWYFVNKYDDPLEAGAFASAAASFMVESVGPHFKMIKKEVFSRFEVIFNGVKKVG